MRSSSFLHGKWQLSILNTCQHHQISSTAFSNDNFPAVSVGTVTISLPAPTSPWGTWTAVVHSSHLAKLPGHVYGNGSRRSPGLLLPSDDRLPNSTGQLMCRHQQGLQVDSNLLEGSTVTALLELVTAAGCLHTSLHRMVQLMRDQRSHLRRMLPQQPSTPARQLPTVAPPTATAAQVKSEPGVAGQQDRSDGLSGHTHPVKLEHQEHLAAGSLIKAESGGQTGRDVSTAGSGRRRPLALAWHVISSGVVQVAEAGLTHAVLQVRPPPPWSSQTAADSPGPVKQETSHGSPSDTHMQDADAAPQDSQRAAAGMSIEVQPGPDKMPTSNTGFDKPKPYLTIHVQWQLTPDRSSTAGVDLPAAAASQSAPAPAIRSQAAQNLPHQQPAAVSAASPQVIAEPAKILASAMPVLGCCITSEPQVPHQVLQSFQNMAGNVASVSL